MIALRSSQVGPLAVAALLRTLWALWVPVRPTSDAAAYVTFATNLADGGAYGWKPDAPDAYWPPGVPFLYSLFFRAFGPVLEPLVVLNWLMSMAVVVLGIQLVRQWSDERTALLTGWLLALWPLQIELVTVLASELPFTLAMLAAFVCVGASGRASWPRTIAFGIVIAAASYIRPTGLLLPGGLAIVALWRRVPWMPVIARAAAASAIVVLLVVPWALRNQEVFGRLVPISANSGANLWMGNNPESDGGYQKLPADVAGLDTAARDAVLRDRAIAWMSDEPGAAALLAVKKLVMTHARETIGVRWNEQGLEEVGVGPSARKGLALVSTLYWYGVLALACLGFALTIRREGLGSLPVVLWLYFAGVHAITVAMDRYHVQTIPFIAWLAAIGWIEVARWARGRKLEA